MCNYGQHQTADLFERCGHLRTGFEVFDRFPVETDLKFAEAKEASKADILRILKKAPQSTPQAIADALGVKREWVSRNIAEMVKGGVLGRTVANEIPTIEILPGADDILKKLPPPKRTEILLRYSYQKRPEVEGAAVLRTTRPFCKRMMALSKAGRVYSRQDIENLSRTLGYSVFLRVGGFWNNGGTVEIHCRHYWAAEILLKK